MEWGGGGGGVTKTQCFFPSFLSLGVPQKMGGGGGGGSTPVYTQINFVCVVAGSGSCEQMSVCEYTVLLSHCFHCKFIMHFQAHIL